MPSRANNEFWHLRRKRSRLKNALLLATFWTAVGLVFALSQMGHGETWRELLTLSLSRWWMWGLLTPFIIAFDRRLTFTTQQPRRRAAAHLVMAPLCSLLFSCGFALLSGAADHRPWHVRFRDSVHGMFWQVLIFLLIVKVAEVYQYKQRYLRAELQMERLQRNLSEARLHSLRMQLDPHFLFNTLNTISAQVSSDPKLTRQMIEDLGELLRKSLGAQSCQEVPLVEEIAFLEHYLRIQQVRFGEKLKTEIAISCEALQAMVPSLFLQPLVENAIRHGFSSRTAGGSIVVSAACVSDRLVVKILDDGVGLRPDWSMSDHAGLGLTLTRERIEGLHPDGTTHFALSRRPNGGTEVCISFPYRTDNRGTS